MNKRRIIITDEGLELNCIIRISIIVSIILGILNIFVCLWNKNNNYMAVTLAFVFVLIAEMLFMVYLYIKKLEKSKEDKIFDFTVILMFVVEILSYALAYVLLSYINVNAFKYYVDIMLAVTGIVTLFIVTVVLNKALKFVYDH